MIRLVCFILLMVLLFEVYDGKKIRYIATERPHVTYIDAEYISYFNLTSRRFRRGDPFYYVDIKAYSKFSFGNNVSVHFYFYEFLSNRYRRGFVEMHFKWCDLVEKDMFFGSALRQGKLKDGCPFPAGEYNLYNMTIPLNQIPRNFPFNKGRIYCNATKTVTKEIIFSAHIDMEIKEAHINN